ncbi:T9SS type A sorting domain-containing protein [Flavobacterium wongokense]|uniref:T9SS type A sorting domain-containing protein n=1 Tax=Flavobacterium wongokense TaxID=2910674 RepID=UPI001F21FAFF|nr:T9SS type A sorting domain-containing protein [Flavobacterium sp. WG47]MCF6132952.1 T9SS type A sorting domain-containing protein [Flavobacterium sp. WG47]
MNKKILSLLIMVPMLMFSQDQDMNGNFIQNGNLSKNNIQQNYAPLSVDAFENQRALTELNTNNMAEAYPWISPDGLRLYFTQGLSNTATLKFTSRPNVLSNFATPVAVGINYPVGFDWIRSGWLSPDELDIYISAVGEDVVYYSHRSSASGTFTSLTPLTLNGAPSMTFSSGAFLDSTLNNLYLFANLTAGGRGLLKFTRTSTTAFNYVGILESTSPYTIQPGQFSKDDLTFVFAANYASNDFRLSQLARTSTGTDFALTTFSELQGVNNLRPINSQPTVSNNMEWIVFVKNTTGLWDDNDLYIAHNDAIPLGNSEYTMHNLSIYPNPSNGKFNIQFTQPENGMMEVYNAIGQKIIEQEFRSELDLSGYSKGVYLLKFTAGNYSTTKKVVVE